jgi:iron complex outermembrane receptor protein
MKWNNIVLAGLLATLIMQPVGVMAQEKTPAETTEQKKEEEKPFVLPPVIVIAPGYRVESATTGAKTDTPLIETPQSISVITRERLDDQKVDSVSEALLYTPGVSGTDRDERTDFFVIRGFDPTETGLYRDGLQLKSSGPALFRFDSHGVEKIEVLRGPASVLYGQMNPGGLVNIVTKRPTAEPLRNIELEGGRFGRLQGSFDLGGPIDREKTLLYRLVGRGRDSDSYVDFVKDDRVFIAPALTWRPNANTTLTFLGHYQVDDTGTVRQFLPASGTFRKNPHGKIPRRRFAGEPKFEDFDRHQYSIGYLFEHRPTGTWTLRQNLRYDRLDLDYETLFGFGLQADQRTLNRFSFVAKPDTNAFALDSQAQGQFTTGPLRHTLLFGLDYQLYGLNNRSGFAFDAPPIDLFNPVYGQPVTRPPFTTKTKRDQDQIGVYFQDQMKLFEQWVLVLGGRHDWADSDTRNRIANTKTSQADRDFTWRAGLVYLSDIGLAPYFSYAQSFLPVVGTNLFGEPFKPETGEQFEVGLKYQPPGVNAFVTVAYYDLRRQNVLTPDPSNPFNQIQTGEVRSRGVEWEGVASLAPGLNLIASYTYMDAEVTKSNAADKGKRPLSAPAHMASIWADYTVQGGVFAGLGLGAGVRFVGSAPGDSANTFRVPSYTVADAGIHYDWRGFRLAVNAKNLSDNDYVSSCIFASSCLYGAPLNVTASLRYRW